MDQKLRAALDRDDALEDRGMHADDRRTCHTHQSWAEDCEDRHSPLTAGQLIASANAAETYRYLVQER